MYIVRRSFGTGSSGDHTGDDNSPGDTGRRKGEGIMTVDEAPHVSPFGEAFNMTGREPTAVRRDADGALAAFKQQPGDPEWKHAAINHAAAVGVDTNGWEPVRERSQVRLPA